jgi:uncharacterized protein YeaO (DUF488 family)
MTSAIHMAHTELQIKRVYAEPSQEDGKRILVDRLWPRGLTKQKARVDLWLKEVAPSNELRKWFAHDPKKWPEFERRYIEELKTVGEPLALLRQQVSQGKVTLLYGARDEEHNEAVVLLKILH